MLWTQQALSSHPSPTRPAKHEVVHGVNGTKVPGWMGDCGLPAHAYPSHGSWWWARHRAVAPRGGASFYSSYGGVEGGDYKHKIYIKIWYRLAAACHYVRAWASYLTSPSLSFLAYKMRTKIPYFTKWFKNLEN